MTCFGSATREITAMDRAIGVLRAGTSASWDGLRDEHRCVWFCSDNGTPPRRCSHDTDAAR